MSDAQTEKVFGCFVQSDTTITCRFGGTGLGLSVCQQLVEIMNGHIDVNNLPGAGSEFWFELPLLQCTEVKDANIALPSAIDANERKQAHILVAEDNTVNRIVISGILKRLGHRFALVENGQEALEAFTDGGQFDLVLMDCKMPATLLPTPVLFQKHSNRRFNDFLAL